MSLFHLQALNFPSPKLLPLVLVLVYKTWGTSYSLSARDALNYSKKQRPFHLSVCAFPSPRWSPCLTPSPFWLPSSSGHISLCLLWKYKRGVQPVIHSFLLLNTHESGTIVGSGEKAIEENNLPHPGCCLSVSDALCCWLMAAAQHHIS